MTTNIQENSVPSLIQQAREAVSAARQVNPATARTYARVASRILAERIDIRQIDGARRTYYVARAALRWYAVEQLRTHLGLFDGQPDADQQRLSIETIRGALGIIAAFPGEAYPGQALVTGRRTQHQGSGESTRPTAKRIGIGRMPAGWREDLLAHALARGSKYSDAIAVLCLTGARPAELEIGVAVEYDEAVDRLVLTVFGAKVTDDSHAPHGQPWRRLVLRVDGLAAVHLAELAQAAGGETTVRVESANLLGQGVATLSRSRWPRRKRPVTPYSFRHQFSADAKNDLQPEAVAQALGQASTATQQGYGLRRQGHPGRTGIVRVDAARNVRVSIDNSLANVI